MDSGSRILILVLFWSFLALLGGVKDGNNLLDLRRCEHMCSKLGERTTSQLICTVETLNADIEDALHIGHGSSTVSGWVHENEDL